MYFERWKEHFSNYLNQEGTADPEACKNITKRPVRQKLCDEITITELDNALKTTESGKASDQDGIPADILRHGGIKLKSELLKL